MISSEVQRTLVKSPPELWTELSDPASLGRHLGEFGEIRITRVEPEKTVEWEAENTSGSVLIKPSGWGTRVILKATRALPEPEPLAASEPAATAEDPGEADAEPAARVDTEAAVEAAPEPGLQADAQPQAADDLEPLAEIDEDGTTEPMLEQGTEIHPEPPAEEPADWAEPQWEYEAEAEDELETEPRRGFLARLFGWRRRQRAAELAPGPPDGELPLEWRAATDAAFEPAQDWPQALELSMTEAPQDDSLPPEPAPPEPLESLQLEPATPREAPDEQRRPETPSEQGISGELATAEAVAAEDVATEQVAAAEVTAVLTSMLDRLGTAHHRPFSRA
jgi:hypothetical protein